MIRAIIVEDEPLAAQFLRGLLQRAGRVEVVGIARDGETGLTLCAEQTPEAAFLDIRLPGPDGLALAALLARLPRPPLIVFTTGHADRASDAFRVEAVDYLLKPLEPTQVQEAILRLEDRLAHSPREDQGTTETGFDTRPGLPEDRLSVKMGADDVIKLLPRWEIVAALRHDRRTWIHTAQEEYATYYPLDALLRWLGDPPFLRVSREAIINLQAVEEVVHYGDRLYQVRLRDRRKTRVEASRSGGSRLAALLKPAL
jgi:two-component system LytT family response regulator/two-component system response regulator LytT